MAYKLRKLRPLMRLPLKAIGPAAFVLAGVLSFLAATLAVAIVENRSAAGIRVELANAGIDWAELGTDGLQVILTGTAPSEADRFHALSIASAVVDPDRLTDAMDVIAAADLRPPEFSIEVLRNDDGISLIGLIPTNDNREDIVANIASMTANGTVTDMLESADHPIPEGWKAAVAFGLEALGDLPRSKISITSDRVSITAISDSAAEKARLESDLARKAPRGLKLALDISAPRPVIAPFTLRFLVNEGGARFDACSADNERARSRILVAAAAAGLEGKATCTIGLGVPTPEWADAVVMGLAAVKELGAASITYSDADISLIADASVSQSAFDRVVGELESNLPAVFSLHTLLTPKAEAQGQDSSVVEFTASLNPEGRIELRGRIGDELSREAVESFARSRFGTDAVHAATRLDPNLPIGWPLRVLSALEALGELNSGEAVVRVDSIKIAGVTGNTETSDTVSRMLSDKLGTARNYELSIRYDPALDPLLGLPTAEDCAADINQVLSANKINFEPGSAQIAADAKETLDKIAELMKDCSDFPMEIAGHTDSQGREEMNLALSRDRAHAVVAALMARRVLTGNLTSQGFGETQPIADNETEEGRESNRRIEFRLLETASDVSESETTPSEGDPSAEAGVKVSKPDQDTLRPKKRPETGAN
ncbi:MAG: OmpA family protein [Paracoccaceae bacterium]|nr:OmpA family protein [Paracoccaceae bacterium]